MKSENVIENCEADVIEAAGGVVWRETERGREIALIHRARYGDWTLPKGKLEEGEHWQEGALREIKEETGCDVEIESFAGAVGYTVKGVAKVALFWNMKATGECAFQPSEEVKELLWLPPDQAIEKLEYAGEKRLLQEAQQHISAHKNGEIERYPKIHKRSEAEMNKRSEAEMNEGSKIAQMEVTPKFWHSRSRKRLANAINVLSVELPHLTGKPCASEAMKPLWCDLLNRARRSFDNGKTDLGWDCVHAAQRLALFEVTR